MRQLVHRRTDDRFALESSGFKPQGQVFDDIVVAHGHHRRHEQRVSQRVAAALAHHAALAQFWRRAV